MSGLALAPFYRMGPPPRSLAAEAYDCFMVRTRQGSNRIQGCGAMLRAPRRAPLGSFATPMLTSEMELQCRNDVAGMIG